MARLSKVSDGILFHDDFTNPTVMWTLSPSDATGIQYGEDGLRLLHGKRYVTFTIPEPSSDEYSCVVELDHVPFNYKDIGGIIVISNTKEYAECQSFKATGPSSFQNSTVINADIERLVHETFNNSVVLWSQNDEEPESASIYDGETYTPTTNGALTVDPNFVDVMYRYVKFTKIKHKYIFEASTDSYTWIDIGNVRLEGCGVVGFFLYGVDDVQVWRNSHFIVKDFAFYRNRYITIQGINRNREIEIIDGNGHIILRTDDVNYGYMFSRLGSEILINTTTMPTPIINGKLRIYTRGEYNATINTYDFSEKMYGGDSFIVENYIKLFVNEQEVSMYQMYDLGSLCGEDRFVKMSIQNLEDYDLQDVTIEVIAYSEFYGGNKYIKIALDDPNERPWKLNYQQKLVIPYIQSHAYVNMYLKLTDKPMQEFYKVANDYRFKIMIS